VQGIVVLGPPPWAVVKPWLMLVISIATWALAFYAPDLFSVVGALIVSGVTLAPPFRNQIWPSIGSQAVALLGALVAIALGAAWQHANIELHLIVHTPNSTDESRVLYIVQFLYFIFYYLEMVICLSTAALRIILLLFCIAEAGRVCCAAFLTFGALALAVLINDHGRHGCKCRAVCGLVRRRSEGSPVPRERPVQPRSSVLRLWQT
jgi:hypothetical protein